MKKISSLLLLLAICIAFTAFAACKQIETPETYEVTFKNGETVVAVKTVSKGECVTELPECEAADDMIFEGWFAGETEFTATTPVTSDLTVAAKITKKPTEPDQTTYTLTLKLDGDTVYETINGKSGTKVDLYDYSVADYEIHEWADEHGKKYAFEDVYTIAGDAVLTAVNPKRIQFTMQLSDDGNYYAVTGLSDMTASAAAIPETYFGLPVKEITPRAFAAYNNTLKNLTVPDSIEKIGAEAFGGLCSLTELTVPFVGEEKCESTAGYGLKSLFAYWFCEKVDTDRTVEYVYGVSAYDVTNGAETQREYAERYIPRRLTTLTINGGAIANDAFQTIVTIETVNLGNDVTAIGESAFSVSPNLMPSVSIDDYKLKNVICTKESKITSIGANCFSNQVNLTKVCLPPKVKTITEALFRGFEKLTDFVIFDNSELEEIGMTAFYGSAIKTVDLPLTVSKIDTFAFGNCLSLTSATLHKNAVNLGAGIFRGCAALRTVTMNEVDITELPQYTFEGCLQLQDVLLSETVVKINEAAFSNCSSLWKVNDATETFDMSNFTYIGASAFNGTKISRAFINADITYIGDGAFASCSNMELISFANTTAESKLTEIGSHTFDGAAKLSSITLPASVTKIGFRAFSYTGLVKVNLPASLQEIGNLAFFQFNAEDSQLTTITDLKTLTDLTSIGESAFENNLQIVITSLPESIEFIGSAAFRNSGITGTITVNPATLTEIGAYAFANCKKATLEVVGTNSDIPRKWNASWAGVGATATKVTFTDEDEHYVTLSNGFEYYEKDGVYYVTKYIGSDAEVVLQDSFANIPVVYEQGVFAGNSTVTSVTLAPEMTSIPKSFFSECANLVNVIIPEDAKIAAIEDYAFNKCYKLSSLTVSDASELTKIGDYAFYYAVDVTFIEFTNNRKISYVGDYAFEMRLPTYNCALTKLDLDLSKAEYIGEHAFSGDYDLISDYELTSSVKHIGEEAFNGCRKIGITLKEGFAITRFENKVFSQVENLVWEDIDFADVEYIGDNAFSSTKGSFENAKIVIPQSVTYVGNNAFYRATLAGVTINANNELEIGDGAFGVSAKGLYVVINGTPKKIGYAICGMTDNAHIYFSESITVSTTYPRVFTLGESDCEINNMFYVYNEDYEHAVNVPYFGKGQWTTGENGEPIHPDDGHKESSSRGN